MKVVNIAELKNHLSEYVAAVANGEEVEIRKRDVPVARIVPIPAPGGNRTVLGCGAGTVTVKASLTDPLIPCDDWEMKFPHCL